MFTCGRGVYLRPGCLRLSLRTAASGVAETFAFCLQERGGGAGAPVAGGGAGYHHCEPCGERFPTADGLRRHAVRHTGAHRCSVCGKRFASASVKRTHENTHSGRYPYTCPYCGKGFLATNNLKGHMVRHTGVKQFVCSTCGEAFSYGNVLAKHVAACHAAPQMPPS